MAFGGKLVFLLTYAKKECILEMFSILYQPERLYMKENSMKHHDNMLPPLNTLPAHGFLTITIHHYYYWLFTWGRQRAQQVLLPHTSENRAAMQVASSQWEQLRVQGLARGHYHTWRRRGSNHQPYDSWPALPAACFEFVGQWQTLCYKSQLLFTEPHKKKQW